MGRGRRGRRGGKEALTSDREVARRLGENAPRRRFWWEEYGPDGEIVEAREGHVLRPWEKIEFYAITQHGYAEPKLDWRERGVIPPQGIHWAEEPGEGESVEGGA